jgi:integrase
MKGNLTRRGKSSWRLKFDAGRDHAGNRITKFVTLRGTRAQAQAEAAKIIASTVTGAFVDPSAETTATFCERWLRDWANANVSNRTWIKYATLLRKHLVARVGSIPIQKLRAADLQMIYATMAADGLADRTRLNCHRCIHTMLKHAAQWGVVARNVANLVDAPRVKAREIEILTPAEVQSVLDRLREQPLYAIAATLIGTGLRRSELLALRWKNVDLNRGTLRVEQALEHTKRGGLVFKEPKSRHGRRTVTLAPTTVAVLQDHWKAQQQQRLMLGQGRAPSDVLVFGNWDGSARSPDALTRQWARAMKRAGLKVSLHSLRHTHASTLIAAGLDVLTISRRLGHATPVLVLTTYGHILHDQTDRAAAIIEAALAEKYPEPSSGANPVPIGGSKQS